MQQDVPGEDSLPCSFIWLLVYTTTFVRRRKDLASLSPICGLPEKEKEDIRQETLFFIKKEKEKSR